MIHALPAEAIGRFLSRLRKLRASQQLRRRRSCMNPLSGFERLEDRSLLAVTQLGSPAQSHAFNDSTLESFTVPAGTDRLLVVVASDTNSLDVTSVKFGSTALTQAVEKNDGFAVDSIWVLPLGTSTTATTANVTMTRTGVGDFQFIGAVVFQGVYQSSPIGATDSLDASPGSTSPVTRSIASTSTAGDLVFDVFDVYKTASLPTLAPAVGNNQTVVHSAGSAIGFGFDSYKTSTKPATSPGTSMSWTHNGEETLYLAVNIVAAPTPIVVNSTVHGTDSNPATTTLVEAIQQANTNPGSDIISLPSSTTFLSDDALFIDGTSAGRTMYPSITSDITIQGNGSTLDASGKNGRFFHISGPGNLTLENMNLVGGKAQGGDGAGGNFAGGGGGAGMGGAIFVNGSSASLTVRNTMIANSLAKGGVGSIGSILGGPGGGGGGMGGNGANSGGGGPRSAASGNSGGDAVGGNGGANNGGFGGGGGGGISPSAAGVGGFGGGGGGGWSSLPTYGTGGVGGFGGGGGGTTTPFATPFAAGGAFGGRGGAYNSSGFASGGGGAGLGGGIFNYQGKVTLENVFLVQNNATGGSGQSLNGVGAGSGAGGAIFNYDGTVLLKHVTSARNTVATGLDNPGVATGGVLYNYDAPGGSSPNVTISNSILSNSTYTNATGVEAFNNGSGTIQTIGANNSSLVTSSTGMTGTVLTSDPQLSVLESISGKLLIRPFAGSPVIDAADPSNAFATDAVETVRPQGAGPDMGAAEGAFDSTVSLTVGTIVLGDTNADAVFAVNPVNGKRSLISKLNVRGTGPDIGNPRGIAIDSANNIYVVNTSPVVAIIKIDPATGNRTTVSSSTVGTGTNFSTPSGIAIRADGNLIVSDTGGTNGAAGGDAIIVVNPTTGNRTILSDDVTPNATNALTTANAILFHKTLGILVSDSTAVDTVTRIDGTTGAKTIFSSGTVPNGTNPLVNPQGLAEDTDGSILLVEQTNDQLLRLNPSTGARTVVSTFVTTDTVEGVAVGTSGIFITKISPNPDQVFKVNASTGALTIAASNSFGDGVLFGAPNASGVQTIGFNLGIAVVPGASNAAPTVANAIADQTATEDVAFSFTFAANTFNDVDAGDTLTYSATGTPAWLTFNAATRTFTGTPTNSNVGHIDITVAATDGSGAAVSDIFRVTVNNVNDAPTVANAIADQTATEDVAFSFTFAANTFNDVDAGDTLAYSATGTPAWLTFNAATRTFTGTPTNSNVGHIDITVTATDGSGAAVSDIFRVTVNNVNDAPTLSSFGAVVGTTNEDTEVEITLAELLAQGNEADVDGTVDAFVVQAVSTGTLKIGMSAGTAAPFAANTNNKIDGTNKAYWTPANSESGNGINAFTVIAQDNDGANSTGAVQATVNVTAVNVDTAAPTAIVRPLPLTTTTSIITLTIDANDPAGAVGDPVSGVSSYDVYVAVDSGAWTLFADDVPATQSIVNFTGTSNHRYWFRAVAKDNVGNTEVESATPNSEANTFVTDFEGPNTAVTSATADANGLFTLNLQGSDVGGSTVSRFRVFVKIDDGATVEIPQTNVNAGAVNGSGVHSATTTYQGLRDGMAHSYTFFTRGIDSVGNLEAAPTVANADIRQMHTFAAPVALAATDIDVQNGQTQRSYIRNVDLLFNDVNGLQSLIDNNRIRVERFDLLNATPTAGTGTNVSISGVTVIGNSIKLDFGTGGLGGVGRGGNGFYRILVDTDGDNTFDNSLFEFFRLYGDSNGDGNVTSADGTVTEDLSGDGLVNATDRSIWRNERSFRLLNDLFSHLDD